MQRNLTIGIIILAMVLPLIWANVQSRKTTKMKLNRQDFINGLELTNYNEQGRLINNLKAKQWIVSSDESKSNFIEPKLLLLREKNHWDITAKQATAYHKSLASKTDKVTLTDDVVIKQQEIDDKSPGILYTKTIDYYPDPETIATKESVVVEKPGKKVTGQGLDGDLKKNTYKIRKNARTTYTNLKD